MTGHDCPCISFSTVKASCLKHLARNESTLSIAPKTTNQLDKSVSKTDKTTTA